MSTTLKGAPIIGLPSGTLPSIKATLRYTRDYPGGVLGGLGAGSHEIEYVWPAAGAGVDMFAGSWRHVISLASVQVAAAPFAGGGVQPEGVIFIGGSIKYATGNAQPFELRRLPVETSAGVMDLRVLVNPPAYTTPQSLAELVGSLEGLNTSLTAGLVSLDAGLIELAETQADVQTKLAQNMGIEARLAPLHPAVFPAGTYINGVPAVFGWLDELDHPMIWWDAAGKAHLDGGLAAQSLSVTDALTLASASIAALSTSGLTIPDTGVEYVGGVQAVPLLTDAAGRVALALGIDGKLIAPGGIISPNAAQGITYANSRNRIDSVLGVSGPDIAAPGDSLTHGVGQTPYTSALATLMGRTVTNYGLGGQTSTEIAARFGASTTYLSVAGNSIPASGSVAVTVYDVDLLRTSAGASMTVSLYGIKGTLTRAAGVGVFAGAYTFTRTTAGAAVAVPSRVQIMPDTAVLKEAITIIWIGNNNYLEDANIQRDVLAIIRTLEAMQARYLILTMLNGDYPGRRANDVPNTDYTAMMATNRNLMRLSNHVIDIQKLLPKVAATDVVDPAYRIDEIHLNTAGYALVAGHIRDALIARGW